MSGIKMIRSKLSMDMHKIPVRLLLKQLGFAETDDIVKLELVGDDVMLLIKSDVTEELE